MADSSQATRGSFPVSKRLFARVPPIAASLSRVFWFGPLIGGALAPVVWEAILRPEQPVSKTSAAGASSGMVTASSV